MQLAAFEEQEKRYLRKVLVEERTRYCTLATSFRPFVVSTGGFVGTLQRRGVFICYCCKTVHSIGSVCEARSPNNMAK